MMLKFSLLQSSISVFLLFFNTPSQINWETRFWQIQSIDTMKYSRDASRAPLNNDLIDFQVRKIAETGATHVAIDTPYDNEFLERLKIWVATARKYNLKIWFRGNFSGWEGWFDYPKNLTREEHLKKTREFILDNPDLFQDSDIFTACPECENGGPGDPRSTGDTNGFRKFMIDEYAVTKGTFNEIGKSVVSNYNSMNLDVANLVMDEKTTLAMDEIIVIDHYVKNPDRLSKDINDLAKRSGGRIILGEFGAPIPDINGDQGEGEQADWVKNALIDLSQNPNLIGINYWVGFGGSTALWNTDNTDREVVDVLANFYKPSILQGKAVDNVGHPIQNVEVYYLNKYTFTNNKGTFKIPYQDLKTNIYITKGNYTKNTTVEEILRGNRKIVIPQKKLNLFELLLKEKGNINSFFMKVLQKI